MSEKLTEELSPYKKSLNILLIFQLISIPAVICIFMFLPQRGLAGLVASTIFISFGLYGIKTLKKYKESNIAIWLMAIQLYIFALPMLIVRLFNWGVPFENLSMLGLRLPFIHRMSEYFYVFLFMVLIYERFVPKRDKKTEV